MFERIIGVFKLDKKTFEGIEADESATSQAAIVVLLVGLLAGIGAAIGAVAFNNFAPGALASLEQALGESGLPAGLSGMTPRLSPFGAFFNALIGALLSWLVWSAITYFVGTKLFGGQATFNEMLRMLGFAQAPRLLGVFGFIPCLGGLLSFAGAVWALVASFVAIREGLDIDNGKTVLTVIVSWLAAIVVTFLVGLLLAPLFALGA
jgi:hypothetical protein